MKIPHYMPTIDFRGWLAWRLRVWAGRVEPERPRVVGPLPENDGTVGWIVMQGEKSLAGFRTESSARYPAVEPPPVDERNAALMRAIFPDREGADDPVAPFVPADQAFPEEKQ